MARALAAVESTCDPTMSESGIGGYDGWNQVCEMSDALFEEVGRGRCAAKVQTSLSASGYDQYLLGLRPILLA